MRIRTCSAAVAAAGLLAIATPVAGASAPASPTAFGPPAPQPPALTLTFVPPRVARPTVDIGPTIINGQVVDPGLHVIAPDVSLPPISWTVPSTGPAPRG